MTYLAVVNAAALVAAVAVFAGLVRSLIRQHARERDLLVNQLCHLAGRTWSPPPARDPEPGPTEPRWVDPDQLAEHELAFTFAGDEPS